jgi:hypothetical protein
MSPLPDTSGKTVCVHNWDRHTSDGRRGGYESRQKDLSRLLRELLLDTQLQLGSSHMKWKWGSKSGEELIEERAVPDKRERELRAGP